MDSFSKANEAFVAENYADAVELYTQAIAEDESKDEFYANRAHAYLKLEKYKDAIGDADKAIGLNSKNAKAYLRKGIACFHLEDYLGAKLTLEDGQKLDASDKHWSMWLRKCEAEIDLARQEAEGETGIQSGISGQHGTTTTTQAKQPQKPPEMPPVLKKKYDWYQTETQVVITLMLKNTKKEDLNIDVQERSLSVSIKLPTGSDFCLELDLAHTVVPEQTKTRVVPSKIEIKLKKQEGVRWEQLEGDPDVENTKVKQFNPTSSGDPMKYPSSAHYTRNWDKVVADIKKEEKDEKLEGDAALNQLFQQIYADGSDEVKKAMNKSFSESGGTVLSTNWKEVGNKPVECKPPDGMEYKKYDS